MCKSFLASSPTIVPFGVRKVGPITAKHATWDRLPRHGRGTYLTVRRSIGSSFLCRFPTKLYGSGAWQPWMAHVGENKWPPLQL